MGSDHILDLGFCPKNKNIKVSYIKVIYIKSERKAQVSHIHPARPGEYRS